MRGIGVVAIHPDRLDALVDTLARVADDVLVAGEDADAVLASVGRSAPAEVADLRATSSRLRLLGLDTRRRLEMIRRLPRMSGPFPTSLLLGRAVPGPSMAAEVAGEIDELFGRIYGPEVTPLLDRLLERGRDPYEAAAALEALGVDGFARLYRLAEHETRGWDGAPVEGLEARIEAITQLLLTASQTVDHPGGLPRTFIDELLPGTTERVGPDTNLESHDLGPVTDILAAAGAGQYLIAATERAVTGGIGSVIVRAGRVIAIVGLVAGIVESLANGGEGLAPAIASGALGVIGAFAGGPVGWIAAGVGLVVWLLSAPGGGGGTPPRRTYPSDQSSPGGDGSENTLNGAGFAVDHAGT